MEPNESGAKIRSTFGREDMGLESDAIDCLVRLDAMTLRLSHAFRHRGAQRRYVGRRSGSDRGVTVDELRYAARAIVFDVRGEGSVQQTAPDGRLAHLRFHDSKPRTEPAIVARPQPRPGSKPRACLGAQPGIEKG